MQKKTIIGILVAILLVSILILSACSSKTESVTSTVTQTATATTTKTVATEVIKWKAESWFPDQSTITSVYTKKLIETINTKLAGKLNIELFSADLLVPVEQQFEALSRGALDMSTSAGPMDSQFLPELQVLFGMPGSWENSDQCMVFLNKYGGYDYFRTSFATKNQYLLTVLPAGADWLATSKPVRKLADFKGMKIIETGPPAISIQMLGGEAVNIPFADAYMAYKLGTADGQLTSTGDLETQKLAEVLKYIYKPIFIAEVNCHITLNLDSWKKLGPDLQNQVTAIVNDNLMKWREEVYLGEEHAINYFKEQGGEIITFTGDDLTAVNTALRGCWKTVGDKAPKAAEAIELLKKFMTGEGIK
jgi:TRAP-type C4-dicarboxylate transport system substrate-binding protein